VVGVAGITALTVVTRGPHDEPTAAEPSVAGRGLPSFAPSADSDPDPGRVTPPGQRSSAQRGQRSGLDLKPVTSAPGTSAPTPAAQLLDRADNQLLAAGPDEQENAAADRDPGGTDRPGDGQGPGGSQPGSTPKPSHKPKPTPEPSPDPTPSEPPPSSKVDVGVSAWQDSEHHGEVRVWAKVSGVPDGNRVRLTATASNGDFHARSWGCYRSGRSYTCTATPGHTLFTFEANANSRPLVTFKVIPPRADHNDENDSASVQVSGGRGSSG
jgi:hypothetical protein